MRASDLPIYDSMNFSQSTPQENIGTTSQREPGGAAQPILVTGSHRSGTTWVGKTLAAAPEIGYIKEPFRPNHRPGITRAEFPYWFQYVCAENEDEFFPGLSRTLAFDYDLVGELKSICSPKDLLRMGRDYGSFRLAAWRRARPLMKDPIALFSAPWLENTFNMQVIVLIRHPAAFAASLLRKGFHHPFQDFLDQPLLMRDYLEPFRDDMEQLVRSEHTILEEAVLLWRMFYATVARFRVQHPQWIFVRHADISRAPIAHYKRLFRWSGVPFPATLEAKIQRQTEAHGQHQTDGVGDRYMLDSVANITAWKRRLSPEQVLFIRHNTEDVAHNFYDDEDW